MDSIKNELTSSANIYEPVRNAITKCATFRPIVEKYGLDDMSDTGLIVYAQAIGTTETFAGEIYSTAVENKKQTKEYMTYDEAEVYAALNKVYGYKVFALPGGQNITENFNRTKFDSTTSVYLHNPRDKGLPYTTGIYVPILMNRDGKVSQKAYVDASNSNELSVTKNELTGTKNDCSTENESVRIFEERFKNIENGSIQSIHDNIDNLRNVHIAGLKTDLTNVKDALYILLDIFGDLKNIENGSIIQSIHNNIDNLRNEHIAGLKTDLTNVKNALYILQDIFGDLQNNIDGLRGELSDIKKPNGILEDIKNSLFKKNSDEIQRLKDDIARLNREVDNLQKSLQAEKDKVIAANQNYINAVTRLNVKDGELSRTQRELDCTRHELDDTRHELDDIRHVLSITRHELDTTRGELNNMTSSLSIYEPVRTAITKCAIFSFLDPILKALSNVRTAITKCAIFSPIVEKYGLDNMSDTGLIVYAQAIGKTDNFAFEIYNTALENKKQTEEYMTYDEAEVYDALNKVYGYDVFALPGGRNITENFNLQSPHRPLFYDLQQLMGGQNITENFHRTSFDSTTSRYLYNPRDKNLPYTTGVYVPILMNKDGRVSQKAYVDAAITQWS